MYAITKAALEKKKNKPKISKISFHCLNINIRIVHFLPSRNPCIPMDKNFSWEEKKTKNQYLYKLNKILWNVIFSCYGVPGSSKAHPKNQMLSSHPEFLTALCPLRYRTGIPAPGRILSDRMATMQISGPTFKGGQENFMHRTQLSSKWKNPKPQRLIFQSVAKGKNILLWICLTEFKSSIINPPNLRKALI